MTERTSSKAIHNAPFNIESKRDNERTIIQSRPRADDVPLTLVGISRSNERSSNSSDGSEYRGENRNEEDRSDEAADYIGSN
jgi:hypothetical protein